jgi:PAS domain S-box-containing protein
MDRNFPASTSSRAPLEILRKQIGDLHLSLRLSLNQTASPIQQELGGLQQLIDKAVLGVYRSTLDGRLVMANMALARIFGYDSPEDMMDSVTDIGTQLYVEPERRKTWCLFFQNQEMIGPVLWQGYRNKHELLWLEDQSRVIRDDDGHIWGYEGIVLDVTERYTQEPLSQNFDQKVKLVEEADSTDSVKANEHLRQELADAQQMIAALREQLDRFQIATMGSQEGLWETRPLPNQPWDSPETPTWYSSQFIALLGFEEHEFPPFEASWASRIHPEDRDRVFQAMRDHIEHHVPYEVESRLKTKQGEYRWFKGKGQAIFDKQGTFIRGGGTISDITERKRSEEALEAIIKGTVVPGSRDFFQNLVRQLAHTLQVSMVFIAERIEETFPVVRGLAFWHGDHFEQKFEYNCLEGPCEKVFSGHPVYFPQGVQELFPKNQTVKVLNVEGYCGTPLFNSEGDIVGNLAIMDHKPLSMNAQDQSLLQVFAARAGAELERKRAQEALQKSQERYRVLYDEAPLMYFTVDAHLRILSVNKFGANMLGYTNEELVGMSAMIVVDPDDQEIFCREIEACFTSMNQASQKIFRKVKKDGTRLWVRETSRSIVGPNQQQMLLLACEDITEQKRVEGALEKSEKQLQHTQKMEAIGTLAGGIAHDFNNILGAILGYSELALAQAKKEPKLISYLEEVLTAGNRAKELVKQILAFSRRSDHEREAVDLNAIVQEALSLVRATLPTTIEIRSTLAMDPAVVFADPTQIHQVIMNLCANAEQAMREHGGLLILTVTSIEVRENSTQAFPELKPGTYLQLTIQDSGKGMPRQVLERIFEPFFTTKSSGEGTGLGLAVVHGIIVGHGGHIAVSSVVGQGATFTILLPRLDVVLPAQSVKTMEWPKGRGKVLFVDDEEVLARWGEQVLTHLGYTVVTTTNPHEAVELFHKQPDQFDVVVTDQTMPTMSGEALAKSLLEIRHDIPIIVCTGFSHTMSAEKANQLGLKGFLMKPVNGVVLAKTLQKVLQDRARQSSTNV